MHLLKGIQIIKAGLVVFIEAEVKLGATLCWFVIFIISPSRAAVTLLQLHAVVKQMAANEAEFHELVASLMIGLLLLIYCLLNNRPNQHFCESLKLSKRCFFKMKLSNPYVFFILDQLSVFRLPNIGSFKTFEQLEFSRFKSSLQLNFFKSKQT